MTHSRDLAQFSSYKIKEIIGRTRIIPATDVYLSKQAEIQNLQLLDSFGEKIRYYRVAQRLLQKKLANRSGIAVSALARYERNEINTPGPVIIKKIAQALKIKETDLIPATVQSQDVIDFLYPPTTLGAKIRNFRLKNCLQQKDLAGMLGVHKVTICRYENNKSQPDKLILSKLEQTLNVDILTKD